MQEPHFEHGGINAAELRVTAKGQFTHEVHAVKAHGDSWLLGLTGLFINLSTHLMIEDATSIQGLCAGC